MGLQEEADAHREGPEEGEEFFGHSPSDSENVGAGPESVPGADGGQEADGDPLEEEAGEEPAAPAQRRPGTPSVAERVQHMARHAPYRSLRAICVASRGVGDKHRWGQSREGAVAVLGLDYGCMVLRSEAEGAFTQQALVVPLCAVPFEWGFRMPGTLRPPRSRRRERTSRG